MPDNMENLSGEAQLTLYISAFKLMQRFLLILSQFSGQDEIICRVVKFVVRNIFLLCIGILKKLIASCLRCREINAPGETSGSIAFCKWQFCY